MKKRGETISNLNHRVNELEKEKIQLEQHVKEKENVTERLADCEKTVRVKEKELEEIRSSFTKNVDSKTECIQNLSAEVENLKATLRSKDDIIVSMENEIAKQKGIFLYYFVSFESPISTKVSKLVMIFLVSRKSFMVFQK